MPGPTYLDLAEFNVPAAGDLDTEIEQLRVIESVAGALGRGPQPTNSTNVCSGGACCL